MTIVIASPSVVRRDQRIKHLHQSYWRQRVRLIYKRDLLLSQDPSADADRAWEQLNQSWKQPVQQLSLPADPVRQAREFYDTELRLRMEELYNGQYIAIHPESRSYSVQLGYGKAFRALRAQQPLGPIIVHNIGFANSGLKARLRGEQP